MAGDMLDDLLLHSCSVVKAAEGTNDYGHPTQSWTSGQTTTSGLACRLVEMPVQRQAELATLTVTASHELWMPYDVAPATLVASTAERTHRVTNVIRRSDSSSVDAGPFDVKHVANLGGDDAYLKLLLQRVN